ncbi:MAG: O-antigen ligase family protein [Cyanobacteria bacterium P01_F01_bin.42]
MAANLTIIVIRPQEFVPALYDFPIVPLSFGLSMLAVIVGNKNLAGPVSKLVAVFLFATCASRLAGGWFSGAYDWFFNFLPTCIVFFLINAASFGLNSVRMLMRVFALCGIALVVHSLQQHFNGVGWTGETTVYGRVRYIGLLNDPNDLGMFLVMALPFALHFSSNSRNFMVKLFWLSAAGSYLYGAYLTQSRGTMLAAFAVLLVHVYKRIGVVTAGGLVTAGVAAISLLPGRMQRLSVAESSAGGRVDAWYAGLQMFESNPIFGVGAGTFTDHHIRTAHNTLVLVIGELGFVGTLIFIAMFGYGFLMARQAAFRRDPEPQTETQKLEVSVSYALFLSFVGFLVAACFLSRSYVVFPYIILGMITGYYGYLRTVYPALKSFRMSQDFLTWVVISLCCILGCYVVVRVLL